MKEDHSQPTNNSLIKKKIEARFGKVFNLETQQIETKTFDELSLGGNCREVSEIVKGVIGGKRKLIRTRGENPTIYYKDTIVADGHVQAFHAYVVLDNKVWDPITNNWGTLTVEEYKNHLKFSHN